MICSQEDTIHLDPVVFQELLKEKLWSVTGFFSTSSLQLHFKSTSFTFRSFPFESLFFRALLRITFKFSSHHQSPNAWGKSKSTFPLQRAPIKPRAYLQKE